MKCSSLARRLKLYFGGAALYLIEINIDQEFNSRYELVGVLSEHKSGKTESFDILRVFRVETRLKVYRALDI